MGLYITGSLTDAFGEVYSNYYTRIDGYFIDKALGNLQIRVGNYIDKIAAAKSFPIYQEDYADSDAYGYIAAPVNTGSYSWGQGPDLVYPLTQSETLTVTTYSQSWQDQLVDYIDYDDDGNEITVQRTESIEVITTGSEQQIKSRITLGNITGSLYDYSYEKVKDFFVEIYGINNVQDDI
jgi:uncharacterized protein YjbJ (UPF0337 family)